MNEEPGHFDHEISGQNFIYLGPFLAEVVIVDVDVNDFDLTLVRILVDLLIKILHKGEEIATSSRPPISKQQPDGHISQIIQRDLLIVTRPQARRLSLSHKCSVHTMRSKRLVNICCAKIPGI